MNARGKKRDHTTSTIFALSKGEPKEKSKRDRAHHERRKTERPKRSTKESGIFAWVVINQSSLVVLSLLAVSSFSPLLPFLLSELPPPSFSRCGEQPQAGFFVLFVYGGWWMYFACGAGGKLFFLFLLAAALCCAGQAYIESGI